MHCETDAMAFSTQTEFYVRQRSINFLLFTTIRCSYSNRTPPTNFIWKRWIFFFLVSTKFSFMIIRTNRKISEKKTILVPDFFRWRIYILNVSFRDTFESRPSKILCRLTGYTLHFFFLFWYSLIIRPYILTHVFKGIRIPLWKRLQYY